MSSGLGLQEGASAATQVTRTSLNGLGELTIELFVEAIRSGREHLKCISVENYFQSNLFLSHAT